MNACRRVIMGVMTAYMLLSFFGLAAAQTAGNPEEEYKKQLRISEDVRPLGPDPFGEQISLYDGSLSFDQKDVDQPGTGLPILLERTFHPAVHVVTQDVYRLINNAFVDWDLVVPHIETLSAESKWTDSNGHKVDYWFFLDNENRCSRFEQAGDIVVATKPGSEPMDWYPNVWWHGYQLIIPGAGSQDLLKKDSSNSWVPQMVNDGNPVNFTVVTKKQWALGCLLNTSNGVPGEGFLAVSPDGVKYNLDVLIYKDAMPIAHPGGGALKRRVVKLMASRATDRFGNWLKYLYDSSGNLLEIDASDGRVLKLGYETWQHPASSVYPVAYRVKTVSLLKADGSRRQWVYSYGTDPSFPRLVEVDLPDNSTWAFDMGGLDYDGMIDLVEYLGCSYTLRPERAVATVGTIRHPSGLLGKFTMKSTIRGRSNVPRHCTLDHGANYLEMPNVYVSAAIQQREYSGAGISPLVWKYSYSSPNQSWSDACASGCASTVWTDQIDPAGKYARYTFSNRFDGSESLPLQVDYYSDGAGSSLLRSEITSYLSSGPWPAQLGSSLQTAVNDAQYDTVSFPASRTIKAYDQGGVDTYTWQAEAFNAYGQAVKTKRFNSIGTQALEEQTTYLNDLPHWVLGLPTMVVNVTNAASPEEETRNDYDLSNVTLSKRYRFGQQVMSYAYNLQGQLASFTDGNNHTTSLGSYKRGIPQSISYPDGKSQSLVVDDFGQISSITDQAGAVTSYGYDAVGRLTGITYPTGDEQAWLPKSFAYDYVTVAERGLEANHWRRTVSHGNARTVTYFDAELRPLLSDAYDIADGGSHVTTRTSYDWKGQATFTSYPASGSPDLGAITTGTFHTYDALGRLIQTRQTAEAPFNTLTTSTAYLSGARRQVTDPKGKVTTTSYQVFDQPSYDAVIQVQAPAGVTQAITRDVYGNPTAIRQYGTYNGLSGDLTKTLIYDSYHRLCRTVEPESNSETVGYDAANNLAWSVSGASFPSTDGGCHPELEQSPVVVRRSYDEMNRLHQITAPTGTQSTTYHYDSLGNVDIASSGISTWTASRNKLGQLTSEALQLTGQGAWTIGYAHDASGNLRQLTYPDGEAVAYAPDALGRATRAGNYVTGITYAPNGAVASFTYGNGATSFFEQNSRQLLSNFTVGRNGVADLSEDLAYDANGNITGTTDQAGGPRTKSFSYDDLNRLTSASASGLWGSESYTYDPLNNIRSRVSGGGTFAYNYDALNRLSSITSGSASTPFVYDNRGNVISKNGVALEFDLKNQLLDLPGHVTYAYDAAGRRVSKTPASSSPTYYFYSQAGQLLYQVEAGAKTTNFVYLGSKLVARNVTNLQAPPSPPTLTVPSSSTNGSYTVSWSVAAGATYNLQEQINGGAWAAAYSGNATSKAFSGKGNGTYGYRVQACNSIGCGAWSAVKSVTVLLPPAAPATITVPSASTGNIAVSWAASSTATNYTLQQRLGSGGWTAAYSGSATSTTRTVTASGSYTFQVQACNASGCSGWKLSSAVNVVALPVGAPSLTVPTSNHSGSYTASWTTVANATTYTLQEQANGGAWGTLQSSSAMSKAISGKSNGTYGYRVQGCNTAGCGPWSATASIAVSLIPPPPTNVKAIDDFPNEKREILTIQWTASPGATTYDIHNINTGAVFSVGNVTSRIVENGNAGTIPLYGYEVRACNDIGCSSWAFAN